MNPNFSWTHFSTAIHKGTAAAVERFGRKIKQRQRQLRLLKGAGSTQWLLPASCQRLGTGGHVHGGRLAKKGLLRWGAFNELPRLCRRQYLMPAALGLACLRLLSAVDMHKLAGWRCHIAGWAEYRPVGSIFVLARFTFCRNHARCCGKCQQRQHGRNSRSLGCHMCFDSLAYLCVCCIG